MTDHDPNALRELACNAWFNEEDSLGASARGHYYRGWRDAWAKANEVAEVTIRELTEELERERELGDMVEAARRSLSSVAEAMTEHAYQELASALESPPRIAGRDR